MIIDSPEGRILVVNNAPKKVGSETPLEGWIPFNSAGEPIQLMNGPLKITRTNGTTASAVGEISLRWGDGIDFMWEVESDPHDEKAWTLHADGDSELEWAPFGEPLKLRTFLSRYGKGHLPGQELGNEVGLTRIVSHWVNLPRLGVGTTSLHEKENGHHHTWAGRLEFNLGPWEVRIDARKDLDPVYTELKSDHTYAVTHVMELVRDDGSIFNAGDATAVLDALQFGMSFALGRWTCPAVSVGYDKRDHPQWIDLTPRFVDHPSKNSLTWWHKDSTSDLIAFLKCYFDEWIKPERRHGLQFMTTSAVLASASGFVEQRLMTSSAALEHLSWTHEVVEGKKDERKWRNLKVDRRFRDLLATARIPATIDPVSSPGLAAYLKAKNSFDSAAVITDIRHSITHPKDPRDIYGVPGQLAEACHLANRYLDLLILHRIGYVGRTIDTTKNGGWYGGNYDLVPWSAESN